MFGRAPADCFALQILTCGESVEGANPEPFGHSGHASIETLEIKRPPETNVTR